MSLLFYFILFGHFLSNLFFFLLMFILGILLLLFLFGCLQDFCLILLWSHLLLLSLLKKWIVSSIYWLFCPYFFQIEHLYNHYFHTSFKQFDTFLFFGAIAFCWRCRMYLFTCFICPYIDTCVSRMSLTYIKFLQRMNSKILPCEIDTPLSIK